MISCAQAVEQLWDYLENDVAEADRDKVEEHLAFCRTCCGELEFADELRAVLAAAAEVTLPPDVEERLADTLDTLAAESWPATSNDPNRPGPSGGTT